MNVVVLVFASLAAALHIVVFVWEALMLEAPWVHQRIFAMPTADVSAVRLWAFGVGFYNLFLGSGTITGLILWGAGNEVIGRTLVIYTCLFMFLSSIVLFVADRLAMGRPRGAGIWGAVGEGIPALVALIAAVV